MAIMESHCIWKKKCIYIVLRVMEAGCHAIKVAINTKWNLSFMLHVLWLAHGVTHIYIHLN